MLDDKINGRHISPHDFWKTLESHGIKRLTTEADATGLRMLVDLTESGAELYAAFLGGCEPTKPNWNSGAIKSAFVPFDMLRSLVIFALMRGHDARAILAYHYWRNETALHLRVFETVALARAFVLDHKIDGRLYYAGDNPRDGNLSNIHIFSGRSQ